MSADHCPDCEVRRILLLDCSTAIWVEFLEDFTARNFFFLADKMEKEGEKGVMAGYGGRQIFPTQLKSESWKMKAEKAKKKKKRSGEKITWRKSWKKNIEKRKLNRLPLC